MPLGEPGPPAAPGVHLWLTGDRSALGSRVSQEQALHNGVDDHSHHQLGPEVMAENQLCSAAPTRLVGHTRVSFQDPLTTWAEEDKANHLTKTDSKLSSQIHEAVPRPWA